MKKNSPICFILFFSLFILSPRGESGQTLTIEYDPLKASYYAFDWSESINPAYYDWSEDGDEDANFVSQALIAGGMNFMTSKDKLDKKGCFFNRKDLYDHLILHQKFEVIYIKRKTYEKYPPNLGRGDIVFWGEFEGLNETVKYVGIIACPSLDTTGQGQSDWMVAFHKKMPNGAAGTKLRLWEAFYEFGDDGIVVKIKKQTRANSE